MEKRETRVIVSIFVLFLFSCHSNCNPTATNPSFRISLSTTCTGHACNSASYQWKLVRVDSTGCELGEISLTRAKTQTDLHLPGIVFKENQLYGGLTYRFKVTVTPESGPAGMAAYQFKMNDPPRVGDCTIPIQSGGALMTFFEFNCSMEWSVS